MDHTLKNYILRLSDINLITKIGEEVKRKDNTELFFLMFDEISGDDEIKWLLKMV
jgi:hypothetical protein